MDLAQKENARILSSPFVMQMFGLMEPFEGGQEEDGGGEEETEEPELKEEEAKERGREGKEEEGKGDKEHKSEDGYQEIAPGEISTVLEDTLFRLSRGFRSANGPIFNPQFWDQVAFFAFLLLSFLSSTIGFTLYSLFLLVLLLLFSSSPSSSSQL